MNRVMLVGKVEEDPTTAEVNGKHVCDVKVATSEAWGDKVFTTWHRVRVWGKKAHEVSQKLAKGDLVTVDGSLGNRSYEKDGEKRWVTEVKANDVELLNGPVARAPKSAPKEKATETGGDDDQIPF